MAGDDLYGVLDLLSEHSESAPGTERGAAQQVISRRESLKRAGTGIAAALVSGAQGKPLALASGKIPF